MREPRELARVFSILSVENRVRIIELLKKRPLCVNVLAKQLGVSPAAVSQHLRVLRDSGLVHAEKKGYYVHYSLNNDKLSEWNELAQRLLSYDDI